MARGIDYSIVAQSRRLEVLAAIHRLHCELDAMQTEVLATIAADPQPYPNEPPDSGKQWAREDVACALRIAPTAARHELEIAHRIATRFPDALAAMWDAKLSGRMAERLVEATTDLPDAAAAKVAHRTLERVGSQTYAQFAQSLRRAVAAADPRGAEEKHVAAREQRRVVFTAIEHAMTELWALLPADQAAVLRAAVETLAGEWAADPDEMRTADQRRADALAALADGYCALGRNDGAADGTGNAEDARPFVGADEAPRQPGPRVTVNVTVPLSVLLGLDDRCGELEEHGPIPAGVARRLASGPNTVWRRLLVDDHGEIVDISARTYRPPAPMARYVQLRDRTCQFPGCQRRAARCELDHLDPWLASRDTSPMNLVCLCSRHHHLKHEAGWKISRDVDRTVRWTNPADQTYSRPPPEPAPF